MLVDEMQNDLLPTGDQAGQQIESDNCSIIQKEDSFFIARSIHNSFVVRSSITEL